MAYRLERQDNLASLQIMSGEAVLGYLCPPSALDEDWTVFPRYGCESLLPGHQGYWKAHHFAHEADALAFLGIQPAEEARAA